jgi:hypothetical protein
MAPVAVIKQTTHRYDPKDNGILMTPREYDRARFVEGWRYELVNGILIVSRTPLRNERDPNQELGHMLRVYQETHPQGSCLDATLPEEEVVTGRNRRRVDRAIWAGLGRLPRGARSRRLPSSLRPPVAAIESAITWQNATNTWPSVSRSTGSLIVSSGR